MKRKKLTNKLNLIVLGERTGTVDIRMSYHIAM